VTVAGSKKIHNAADAEVSREVNWLLYIYLEMFGSAVACRAIRLIGVIGDERVGLSGGK